MLAGAQNAEDLSDREGAVSDAVTDVAAAAARHKTDELSSAAITLSSLVIESSNVEATQAQLDAVPRERPLGVYGSVAIRRATPAETEWVTAAETAYHDAQPVVVLDDDSF